MPLGSYIPLLLLPFVSLQEGGTPPGEPDAQEAPQEETTAPEAEAEAEPAEEPVVLVDVPTEYSSAWLSTVDLSWRPLDDPGAHVLPGPLLRLPGEREAVFQSTDGHSLLLIRSLPEAEMQIDGFMADEESLSLQGSFIPLEDREHEGPAGHATVFDCEWTFGDLAAQVAATYVTQEDGKHLALWIIATGDATFEGMHKTLEDVAQRFLAPASNRLLTRYTANLNAHEIAFNLGVGTGAILRPGSLVESAHSQITQSVKKVNPSFLVSFNRQWADEESGLSLSLQVIQHDVGFGPASPFMHWVAGVYQTDLRDDIDKGDAPRELLHWDQARTEVISDEGIARHYENCQRTRDAGVILEVLLPRSPYARVCRMSWARPQEGDPNFFGRTWIVELRHYHPGRGETVTGTSVVVLRAHAKSKVQLDALEDSLDFRSRPLDAAGRFPLTY